MKKIILIIVALGVAFAVYWFFIRMNKKKAIAIIQELNLSNGRDLNGLNENMLITWAKAIEKQKQTFEYKGKVYNVKGGENVG